MELKAGKIKADIRAMVFQSHLYGIEREALGLNPSRVVEFQSHLYGIESVVQVLREIIIGVSIAPLWN